MAAKKIEFSAKNVKPFSTWLKKFAAIDKSLLLEVDENEGIFLAKTYNEERSVVKLSKIKFDDAGFVVKESKDPIRVKVGIYNISRLIKIMEQFNDEDFAFVINYDEISGETSEWAGLSLLFKNKALKMNIECTSLNIFKYISDELFVDRIAEMETPLSEFELSTDAIAQINSLCSLDNEYKYMQFKCGDTVACAGKTFDLKLWDRENDGKGESTIDVFKDQFESIDPEDYVVKMGEEKLVFTSTDNSTMTVMSMVEKD